MNAVKTSYMSRTIAALIQQLLMEMKSVGEGIRQGLKEAGLSRKGHFCYIKSLERRFRL